MEIIRQNPQYENIVALSQWVESQIESKDPAFWPYRDLLRSLKRAVHCKGADPAGRKDSKYCELNFCPDCAGYRTKSKKRELEQAQGYSEEYFKSYVVLTFAHHKKMTFNQVTPKVLKALEGLNPLWRTGNRYGVLARIRSFEAVWSEDSGPNPHANLILIHARALSRRERSSFKQDLRRLWSAHLARQDLKGGPESVFYRGSYGPVEFHYIAKSIFDEAKYGQPGLSLGQVLARGIEKPDKKYILTFLDYVHAFHGRRLLTWSGVLKHWRKAGGGQSL
jgi:ribosomal protein L20